MFIKLAVRNIFRQKRRTLLSIAGVAAATFTLVWTHGLLDAFMLAMVQGATAVDVGQLQIRSQAYDEKTNIFNHFELSSELVEQLSAIDGVAGVSPRVHLYGLVGTERRSQVARIIGVDPERERSVSRVASAIELGDWLLPRTPGSEPSAMGSVQVVLGRGLSQQLGVGIGDELVLFVQGVDGSLGNELLKVVGIARTGNTSIDRGAVFMELGAAQSVAALEGRAHEMTLHVPGLDDVDEVETQVAALLASSQSNSGKAGGPLLVRTWKQLLPQLAQMIEASKQSMWLIYLLVYVIAGIGILNTQRMSALERRREFGILLAIGVPARQLGAMLMTETLLLTMMGPVVGATLGLLSNYLFSIYGFNMAMFSSSGSFSYLGVAFDERLFFEASLSQVWGPMVAIAVVGVLCGVVPALSAMRLDAVRSIAGRT